MAVPGLPSITSIAGKINVFTNLANSLPDVQRLITGGAFIIGLLMIFKGIFHLKVYGEARTMQSGTSNIKEPLMYFLVGAALLYLPSSLQMMMTTTFGYGKVIAYTSGETFFGSASVLTRPFMMIIQTIGLVAFVRGWVLIARASSQGQQPGGTGKALMHIFGGILAINIEGTLKIVNNTLYGSG